MTKSPTDGLAGPVTDEDLAAFADVWAGDNLGWLPKHRESLRAALNAVLARRPPVSAGLASDAAVKREFGTEPRGCPTPGACSCPPAAINAAAPFAGEPVAKPLDWRKSTSGSFTSAETIVGILRVWTHHEANGQWFWNIGDDSGDAVSEVEAKTVVTSLYEARIRSALAHPAEQEPGWRTALDDCVAALKAMLKERPGAWHPTSGWMAAIHASEAAIAKAEAASPATPVRDGTAAEAVAAIEWMRRAKEAEAVLVVGTADAGETGK